MLISSRTNLVHNSAINRLRTNRSEMNNNVNSLSGGSRLTRPGQDTGGFMVSTRMNQDQVALGQSIRNINDGISMLQTADKSISNLEGLVIRLRELAIQSANGTYNSVDRANMSEEFQVVTSEIDRMVADVHFNKQSIFNNSETSFDFQVGYLGSGTQRISIDMTTLNADTTTMGLTSATNGIATRALAEVAIEETSDVMDDVIAMRAYVGAYHQRMEIALDNANVINQNLVESEGVISDTDFATASTELTSGSIREQAGLATMGQARNIQQSTIAGLLQS
jgi:flagellin